MNRRDLLVSAATSIPAIALGTAPALAAPASDTAFAAAHTAAVEAREIAYAAIGASWNGAQATVDQNAYRERVCAASRAANQVLIDTPACTVEGIGAKLKYAWLGDEDFDQRIVQSAMLDAERLAGPFEAGQGIDLDIETPVARLYSIITALTARVDASDADEDCPDFVALRDRLDAAEMQMATAPAQTVRDMALKVWFMRDYVYNSGMVYEAIITDAARAIGPDVQREANALRAAHERCEQRSEALRAALGPDFQDIIALPEAQRSAAMRAAGITI